MPCKQQCEPEKICNEKTKRCNKKPVVNIKKSPCKKPCNHDQICNEKTKRCNKIKVSNKNTKKPIGCKKTCEPDQVCNEKTKRCNKIRIPKKVLKTSKGPSSVKFFDNKKVFDKIFGNKSSSILRYDVRDEYTRKKYAIAVQKYVKDIPSCLKLSKDGVLAFGSKLIFTQQIGSSSQYGIAYVTQATENTVIRVAAKIVQDTESNRKEIYLLEMLTKPVLEGKFANFPVMYSSFSCDKPLCKIPTKTCHKLLSDRYLVILNEIANGDLKMWLSSKNTHSLRSYYSAIFQIYLSLMAFNEYGYVHNDAHWGNFLYHDIEPGGYWHYQINGENVFVENTGQLWILWDFGMAYEYKDYAQDTIRDYYRIIHAFIDKKHDEIGWIDSETKTTIPDSISHFGIHLKDRLIDAMIYDQFADIVVRYNNSNKIPLQGSPINAKPFKIRVDVPFSKRQVPFDLFNVNDDSYGYMSSQ